MRKALLTSVFSIALAAFAAGAVSAPTEAQNRGRSTAKQDSAAEDPMAGIADSQKAWQNPNSNMGPGQLAPGYSRHEFNPDQIIRLNLREAMNTTLRFPADEVIEDLYVSDPVSFEGIIPRTNVVLLRVKVPGADGTVTAMGSSGNLYQFYVKGNSSKAPMITDITVDIIVTRKAAMRPAGAMDMNMGGQSRSASASDLKVEADWLRSIGFRPENIVHDLSIFAPQGSAGVAPERVFRDGQYTYIDYGANADAINEWPVASLVVQGVETPVNARTAGPNGRMLVVEAVGDIVLRNGNRIICIKQNGRFNRDPAAPAGAPNVAIRNAPTAVLPPAANSPSSGKVFSVDLDIGTQDAMLRQWQTIRTAHPAEFANTQAGFPLATDKVGLSTFRPNPGEVKLRVGPFYNLADAIRACKAVSATNRRCTVVNQSPS